MGGIIKRFLYFCLAIIFIAGIFSLSHQVEAEGIVRGAFSEDVDGVAHEKIIEYGRSGLTSQEAMLAELNIVTNKEDRIKTFPDPSLGIGARLEILRATPVIVNDAEEIKTYYTWKTNVGDFIREANLGLGSNDVVSPEETEAITSDMEINITRVALSEIKETEEIDYAVTYENDPTMDRGVTKVSQEPEYGKKELTYEVRRENGKEISRELIDTKVTKEPVNKIVLKGTKVVSYGTGVATWYDWISGNTAASNALPYGTKVLVRSAATGKEIEVTIVDSGIQGEAIIDLSADAYSQLAPLGSGKIQVILEKP